MKKTSAAFLIFCVIAAFFGFFNLYCSTPQVKEQTVNSVWLNLHDSVKYIGIQKCRSCHQEIYNTFIHTGMGSSINIASRQKSAGEFSKHPPVYDKYNDYYYKPYWLGDKMMIMEYRLSSSAAKARGDGTPGKDTIHKRIEEVKYIVGSGQHTNSHMMEVNGYIYQMPLTWYAQKKQWDLPPGFEGGNNSRFSRIIGVECMSCHNAYPEYVPGSLNKFTKVPTGIDCERCHGPGELHYFEKAKGNTVDIKTDTDFTIVNPRKLPWELQIHVCQRCHLQGNAVLREGKTFFDFKPGMKLSSVMDIFMPVFKGGEKDFIMASHAERLQMSKCFLANNPKDDSRPANRKLTCITCHNPHVSVEVTGKETFNNACRSCHGEGEGCTEEIRKRQAVNDNCSSCHMPKSGTIDIPHVTVTDHYIRKPLREEDKKALKQFLGLASINHKNPPAEVRAEAYLSQYEKFSPDRFLLDSAKNYFPKLNLNEDEKLPYLIRYYFLGGDFHSIISVLPEGYLNRTKDDWTAYRIGQAFQYEHKTKEAEQWYRKAFTLSPHNLDFKLKYAEMRLENNAVDEAIQLFRQITEANPKHTAALTDLGYALLLNGGLSEANTYYDKALKLDPDFEPALLNKAGLYNQLGDTEKAKVMLQRILKRNPNNQKAKLILESL